MDLCDKELELNEQFIVMETGGMKGLRKEMLKPELHTYLKKGFKINNIQSEYGMTELLSQAYSLQNGLFQNPPWMKFLIREINAFDPSKTLGEVLAQAPEAGSTKTIGSVVTITVNKN